MKIMNNKKTKFKILYFYFLIIMGFGYVASKIISMRKVQTYSHLPYKTYSKTQP